MDGFFLKNGEGVLGLAVLDETRKVQKITYLSGEKNLHVLFTNGENDTLLTTIDPEFEPALFKTKQIFVAHFPHDGLGGEPVDEYKVPLDL